MNKKILMATITLFIVTMMATQMVGTAQACRWEKRRTVEPFYVDPAVDPQTLTGTTTEAEGEYKLVNDDTIKISWGSIKKSWYEGPLGSGWFTMETIISKQDNPMIPVGEGWAINKYTLEIVVDGGYGTGTLKGGGFHESALNIMNTPVFEMWARGSLNGRLHKNGDSNRVKVLVTGYTCDYGIWFTKTMIIS